MRQINLGSQGQSRSIGFDQLSTDAAMAILAIKPVEEYVQNAAPVSVSVGISNIAVSLDGPFLFADNATYSDQENRVVNKGKFAFRSTDSIHEKAKVYLLNAADKTPVQNAQGKELVAFLRVDVANSDQTRLDFHVDNGDGTYSAAVVPAGVTSLLFQWLQRFSFNEVRPEVASTKKFFHGVVDVAVDNDLNQLLKDLYGMAGSFNGTGQSLFGSGQSAAERLNNLDTDLSSEAANRQSADSALQSEINAEEIRAMAAESALQSALDSEVLALEGSIASLNSSTSASIQALQADLAQEVLDRAADVNAEETRALAAEAALQAELNAEEARAQAEEADIRVDFAAADASLQNILQTALSAEEARALAREDQLSTAISGTVTQLASEVAILTQADNQIRIDFEAADTALSGAISALQGSSGSSISDLQAAISAEATRATNAESALQNALDAEETRAMAEEADIRSDFAAADAVTLSSAEDYTDQKISELVNGAPALLDTLKEIADQLANDESVVNALTNTVSANLVEAKAYTDTKVAASGTILDGKIETEKARALAAEASLQSLINAEQTRATNAETNLEDAINDEETRALAVEAGLQSAINLVNIDLSDETARALQAESGLQSALDSEETRALAAESALQSAINAEQTRAEAAESVLQDNIDAEATRAMAAELVLTNGLAQEITNRIAADGILQTFLQGEIDAEETRAMAAEGVLQGNIDLMFSKAGGAIDPYGQVTFSAVPQNQNSIDARVIIYNVNTNTADGLISTMPVGSTSFELTTPIIAPFFPVGSTVRFCVRDGSGSYDEQVGDTYVIASVNGTTVTLTGATTAEYLGQTTFGNISEGSAVVGFNSNSQTAETERREITDVALGHYSTVARETKTSQIQPGSFSFEKDNNITNGVDTYSLARLQNGRFDLEFEVGSTKADILVNHIKSETKFTDDNWATHTKLIAEVGGVKLQDESGAAVLPTVDQHLVVKQYVDDEISSVQTSLATEVSARTSGDSNLQSQVDGLLVALNSYKALVGKPVDMESVSFETDGSYLLQVAPSGIVSDSKPMLIINGVLQQISQDFSIVADSNGVMRKVQLVLGSSTVSEMLGQNGTAAIWYRAVI